MQTYQAGTPAASGSALTSFALNGNSTRVYYLDKDGWIYELGWTGSGWEHTSLAATQGVYRCSLRKRAHQLRAEQRLHQTVLSRCAELGS